MPQMITESNDNVSVSWNQFHIEFRYQFQVIYLSLAKPLRHVNHSQQDELLFI